MEENPYNPTAANILSSLHIKGVTFSGGDGKAGYVPILGEDGTLSLDTIPENAILENIDILPLNKLVFVDPNTTKPEEKQTGSLSSPFKSISRAANQYIPGSDSELYVNFVLIPGDYGSERVGISNTLNERVRFFGIGTVNITTLYLGDYPSGTVFEFYNINASNMTFFGQPCTVALLGLSRISELVGQLNHGTVIANIDSTSKIDSTAGAVDISYISADNRVENTVSAVPGTTVHDAVGSLASRKIKIPVFTADSEGIHANSSDFDDISVPPGGNTHVITKIGTTLAEAANKVFHKDGDSPEYNSVTATTIDALSATVDEITADKIKLKASDASESILSIDSSDLLVIA